MKKNNEEKNKQVELKVIVKNQSITDPDQPVPIEFNGSLFRYVKSKKYIPFLGSNDKFAEILLQARLTSASQNACISSISQSLIGKGIALRDGKQMHPDLLAWMKSVNRYRHTFDESLIAIADGERTFGNQFVEVVKGTILGKKFIKIYPHSFLKCRLAALENETDDSEIQKVIISNSFINKTGYFYKESDLQIPIWSPNILDQKNVWVKDSNGNFRTMLFFKNEVSGVDYYGLPASIAGLRYQILEAKAAQFNIDNFDNNMILGGMLIFKSGMTQSEAVATAREILMTHVGNGKTGRIAVVSSEEGIGEVDFKPYTTAKEGSYNESDKRWEEKIIAANEWDSVLAGINRSSSLGNGSQYIRSIWDVKDAVLLNPLRNRLISKVIKPILRIWGEHFNVKEVFDYEFELHTNMPFSFMGDLDPNTFFQVNEARAKAGLVGDDAKKGVYLSEMRPKNTSNNNIQTNPGTATSTSEGTGTGNK